MTADFLKRTEEAVTKGDFDTAELLFLEEIEEPQGKLDALRAAARRVAEAGERERAADMLANIVDPARAEGAETLLSVLREICLCVPHRRNWRRTFAAVFTEHYAAHEVCLAYMKAADIVSARQLETAFAQVDPFAILIRLAADRPQKVLQSRHRLICTGDWRAVRQKHLDHTLAAVRHWKE